MNLTDHDNPLGITSAAILLNTATGRFHPILFRAAPSAAHPDRQRSKAHHTTGFGTQAEAEEYCKNLGEAPFAVFNWDGVGVPIMTL